MQDEISLEEDRIKCDIIKLSIPFLIHEGSRRGEDLSSLLSRPVKRNVGKTFALNRSSPIVSRSFLKP